MNTLLINGHEYKISVRPSSPITINIEAPRETTDPVLIIEGIEDMTGEYIEFYINSKFICQTPHINNFETTDEIVEWFIQTELEG